MKRMGATRMPRREYVTTVVGKRRVGRPREKWVNLIKDLEERNCQWDEVKKNELWNDEKFWKKLLETEEEDEGEEGEEERVRLG
jgi:hypothetical protein